jgi:hypothetical protein
MKNLNPNSGLKQIAVGKLYLPRRIILENIRNKTLTPNELGYFIIALISADWNEGEYRYGLIRHEIKNLAKIWNIPESTFGGNFKKLINNGVLTKNLNTFQVNDFEYFQKAHAYKNESLSDEDLKEIFGNSLLETEIPKIKTEIPNHNLSKTHKALKIASKVDNKVFHNALVNKDTRDKVVSNRTIDDYQRIYLEGGYKEGCSPLLPEDMKWIDEHIKINENRPIL